MIDPDRLDGVLELIYDSAVDAARQPRLLAELAGLFNAHFADSFTRTVDFSAFGGIAHGLDRSDYEDEFLGVWVKRNVWSQTRPVVRAGEIVTTREMVPTEELRASELFRGYLDARGLHEGLRFDLFADGERIEDISILRDWAAGPYGAEELRAARLLLPHLCRARMVMRRLAEARMLSEAGLATLDQVRTPMMLLDRRGRARHRNAAARLLLEAADGIVLGADGLAAAATGAGTRRLRAMIDRAADAPGRPGRSGAIRLQRPSGGAALLLVALPLSPGGPVAGLLPSSASSCVLLTIIDPAAPGLVAPDQLGALFDLTPAETALAARLLAGDDLRAIAERSGRSINTVRSLLGRLMAKTDTRRQSELMRLLAQLPAAA